LVEVVVAGDRSRHIDLVDSGLVLDSGCSS
jgi:hypothetical protein